MKWKFDTIALHGGHTPDSSTKSRAVPIYQTTSFVFDNSKHAASLFELSEEVWKPRLNLGEDDRVLDEAGNIYTRIMNPTTDVLEKRMALLEKGIGAVAVSSGSSAIFYSILNICSCGDHVISSKSIYGGTYALFKNTLSQIGIEVDFVDPSSADNFEEKIKKNTKCIFLETIGNPRLDVPDFKGIIELSKSFEIPVIVDNTVATPYLCNPIELGANVVVHSLTKFCGGHGNSIGGVVIDGGNFEWTSKFPLLTSPDPSYHGIIWNDVCKNAGYILRLRCVVLRDIGACISPFNSFLILTGLETLHLRMERHCENALKVAEFLESHPKVNWVLYPGLKSHPTFENAKKYLKNGFGGLVGFGIKGGKEAGVKFIESLKLFSHLANIGDAKSLAIHPASTTHAQLSEEEQKAAGITPDFIRLSIGIEHIDDIIEDLDQALMKV